MTISRDRTRLIPPRIAPVRANARPSMDDEPFFMFWSSMRPITSAGMPKQGPQPTKDSIPKTNAAILRPLGVNALESYIGGGAANAGCVGCDWEVPELSGGCSFIIQGNNLY
jgi:hypothetical protein